MSEVICPAISFYKFATARTGNCIFQYLFCKVLEIRLKKNLDADAYYVPLEEFTSKYVIEINDENVKQYLDVPNAIPKGYNILCKGFFQDSSYYIEYRDQLLENIKTCDDYWILDGNRHYIKDFFGPYQINSEYITGPADIVISLRLDDFIQTPCETSDIIPPSFYLNILENITFNKLFIVCDKIKHEWEHKYLEYFNKWNYKLISGSLLNDCFVMRTCPRLIHSNSTLCWLMSFFSDNKITRIIPKTNFYKKQNLGIINNGTDVLFNVKPLLHSEVYCLNICTYVMKNIYPFSYSIPDECIISDDNIVINSKKHILADLIPNEPFTYRFDHTQEKDYNNMYLDSRFSLTFKKCGWDSLRHYEIMANGCIPIFKNIDECPQETLITMPKGLLKNALTELLPWKETPERLIKYNNTVYDMLKHMRENCTTSASINYFFSKIPNSDNIKKILMITCDAGVNYTRELFWIGMKRHIHANSGSSDNTDVCAVEFPLINYLYDDFGVDNKQKLYGKGFTYSMRLPKDYKVVLSPGDIINKIKSKYWDLIIFGKCGPDEGYRGNIKSLPFWDIIFNLYSKDQIAFLFGGDGCQDMTYSNRYSDNLLFHAQFGHCFVREMKC